MPNLSYKSHDDLLAAFGPNLSMGMLVDAPNPDGTGLVEPDPLYGYERQPVTFATSKSEGVTYMTNTNPLVFGPAVTSDWPPCAWFGLFNASNVLVLYGRLRTLRINKMGKVSAFPENDIDIRLR